MEDKVGAKNLLVGSVVLVFGNYYTSIIAQTLALIALDYFYLHGISFLVSLIIIYSFSTCTDEFIARNSCLVSFLLCFTGNSVLFPLTHAFFLGLDRKTLNGKIAPYAERLSKSLLTITNPSLLSYAYPYFGSNDETVLDRLLVKAQDFLGQLGESLSIVGTIKLFTHTTHAEYLREIDTAEHIISMSDKPHVEASKVLGYISTCQGLQRMLLVALVVLATAAAHGNPLVILTMAGCFILNATENTKILHTGKRTSTLKNGVYKVTNYLMTIMPWSHGIGVCYNGVLHLPLHVNGGLNITIGRNRLEPYYISPVHDLVTYGGPPQFTRPAHGDTIYFNNENGETRTTYSSVADFDTASDILAWQGVTRPGDSGSPVFKKEGDTIILIGLAGCYYKNEEGIQTEYARGPFRTGFSARPTPEVTKHIAHPGSGKTFRLIPELVAQAIRADPTKKVLVAGPTRVVCQEIYQSLRQAGFSCGLNIKDSMLKSRGAQVQIASHHTAFTMLITAAPEVGQLGTMIIDEAHVDNSATMALRKYGMAMVEMSEGGIKVHELSATLDGQNDQKSNFHIEEHTIKNTELEETIRKTQEEGKKTLVFVHSTKGNSIKELISKFPRSTVLNRDTYAHVHRTLNNEDCTLIFSTNIAECGINIKDLDCVINTGTRYVYHWAGSAIIGEVRGITTASEVQRRGRIGRTRPGVYYRVEKELDDNVKTAEEVDAEIISAGKDWSAPGGNSINLVLTEKQIEQSFVDMIPATEAYIKFNTMGMLRSPKERQRIINSLKGKGNYYEGCQGCTDRLCAGNWLWFDERIHDLLVGEKKNTRNTII